MNFIKAEDIKISPTRQRRTFDPTSLNELAESITKHGLFHPVVLRKEGEDYVLVSGERRLRAIKDMQELGQALKFNGVEGYKTVPYVLLGELDEMAAEEAELDENIRRADLGWQERAAATARLSSLRQRQAIRDGTEPPSIPSLSMEVRGQTGGDAAIETRQEILVAPHLSDPEVASAASVKDAFKILKKREESRKNIALAESIGRTFTASGHVTLNQDSLGFVELCGAEVYDVILTDPPYGMGADGFGDSGRMQMQEHGYKDDAAAFGQALHILHHSFRIAKPQAHLYVFCDIDRFHSLRSNMQEIGWQVFRTPLIWHKPNGARAPWPEQGPHRKYEMILYAVKGKRPVKMLAPDVLSFSNEANATHGAQKPVGLYSELLRRSVNPGDRVVDMFAGSGPIVEAAHEMKCYATAVEKDPAYYALILKRLDRLKAQQELGI